MKFKNIILVIDSKINDKEVAFDLNHIEQIKYKSDDDSNFFKEIDN